MKLQNEALRVELSAHGAILTSVRKDGHEYIWQRDPAYWSGCDLVLFPYVARLTEGKYTYGGKTYEMPIHGFSKDREFTVMEQTADSVTFCLRSDSNTLRQYPFAFLFSVTYALKGSTVEKTYTVQNTDEKTMYFGLGSHPGFRLDRPFEEWKLVFSHPCSPNREAFNMQSIQPLGHADAYPLLDGTTIALRHDLFDEDAIVLRDMADTVTLCADGSARSVTVFYPDTKYLGIWHMPKTDAGYVCIEPWCSLPSRHGVVEDLAQQPGLLSLPAGESLVKTETMLFR